jgi:cytochrome c biogenesis protein CcdA
MPDARCPMPDALCQTVETLGYGAAGTGFLTGLVFSFNPVAIAAIPVALAYVTQARERREAMWLGGLFVAGLIATHVLLGLIAGLGGRWVASLMGRGWGLALSPLLIALGPVWTGWIKLPLPLLALRAKRPTSAWGPSRSGCRSPSRSVRCARQPCSRCSVSSRRSVPRGSGLSTVGVRVGPGDSDPAGSLGNRLT